VARKRRSQTENAAPTFVLGTQVMNRLRPSLSAWSMGWLMGDSRSAPSLLRRLQRDGQSPAVDQHHPNAGEVSDAWAGTLLERSGQSLAINARFFGQDAIGQDAIEQDNGSAVQGDFMPLAGVEAPSVYTEPQHSETQGADAGIQELVTDSEVAALEISAQELAAWQQSLGGGEGAAAEGAFTPQNALASEKSASATGAQRVSPGRASRPVPVRAIATESGVERPAMSPQRAEVRRSVVTAPAPVSASENYSMLLAERLRRARGVAPSGPSPTETQPPQFTQSASSQMVAQPQPAPQPTAPQQVAPIADAPRSVAPPQATVPQSIATQPTPAQSPAPQISAPQPAASPAIAPQGVAAQTGAPPTPAWNPAKSKAAELLNRINRAELAREAGEAPPVYGAQPPSASDVLEQRLKEGMRKQLAEREGVDPAVVSEPAPPPVLTREEAQRRAERWRKFSRVEVLSSNTPAPAEEGALPKMPPPPRPEAPSTSTNHPAANAAVAGKSSLLDVEESPAAEIAARATASDGAQMTGMVDADFVVGEAAPVAAPSPAAESLPAESLPSGDESAPAAAEFEDFEAMLDALEESETAKVDGEAQPGQSVQTQSVPGQSVTQESVPEETAQGQTTATMAQTNDVQPDPSLQHPASNASVAPSSALAETSVTIPAGDTRGPLPKETGATQSTQPSVSTARAQEVPQGGAPPDAAPQQEALRDEAQLSNIQTRLESAEPLFVQEILSASAEPVADIAADRGEQSGAGDSQSAPSHSITHIRTTDATAPDPGTQATSAQMRPVSEEAQGAVSEVQPIQASAPSVSRLETTQPRASVDVPETEATRAAESFDPETFAESPGESVETGTAPAARIADDLGAVTRAETDGFTRDEHLAEAMQDASRVESPTTSPRPASDVPDSVSELIQEVVEHRSAESVAIQQGASQQITGPQAIAPAQPVERAQPRERAQDALQFVPTPEPTAQSSTGQEAPVASADMLQVSELQTESADARILPEPSVGSPVPSVVAESERHTVAATTPAQPQAAPSETHIPGGMPTPPPAPDTAPVTEQVVQENSGEVRASAVLTESVAPPVQGGPQSVETQTQQTLAPSTPAARQPQNAAAPVADAGLQANIAPLGAAAEANVLPSAPPGNDLQYQASGESVGSSVTTQAMVGTFADQVSLNAATPADHQSASIAPPAVPLVAPSEAETVSSPAPAPSPVTQSPPVTLSSPAVSVAAPASIQRTPDPILETEREEFAAEMRPADPSAVSSTSEQVSVVAPAAAPAMNGIDMPLVKSRPADVSARTEDRPSAVAAPDNAPQSRTAGATSAEAHPENAPVASVTGENAVVADTSVVQPHASDGGATPLNSSAVRTSPLPSRDPTGARGTSQAPLRTSESPQLTSMLPDEDGGYALMEEATAAIHRMMQEQGWTIPPDVAGGDAHSAQRQQTAPAIPLSAMPSAGEPGKLRANAQQFDAPVSSPSPAPLLHAPATDAAPSWGASSQVQRAIAPPSESRRAAPQPPAPRASGSAESMPVARIQRTPAQTASPSIASAPVAPPVVAPINRGMDGSSAHATSVEVVQRAPEDVEEPWDDAPVGMSLEEIARQVYPLIKDLLRDERDRFGRM